jgi:hypothetical protein
MESDISGELEPLFILRHSSELLLARFCCTAFYSPSAKACHPL